MKGIKHNYVIGSGPNRFETSAYRKRPTFSRVNNFLNEMGSDISDYDVYLWGSWPEKKNTWDVDFLLQTPGQLDYEQMEDISKKALNSSLNNNQFLADVGYTNKRVVPFERHKNSFLKTGRGTPHNGYVYGEKWMVDDKVWKDRTKFKNGVVIPKSNNILQINSMMPYPKMMSSIQNNTFDTFYKNKPMKIKDRKKIYG